MRMNSLGWLLAANLALVAALAFLWADSDRFRWSEPQRIQPSLDDTVVASPAEPVDISRYRETIERPVFAATRRAAPRSEAGNEGKPAVDPLKDMHLLGLYGAQGRGGVVVSNSGKVQRVAFGEKIGDWTVAGEEGRSASLVRTDGERRQLHLALNAATPSAPATADDGKAAEPAPGAAAVPSAGRDPARASAGRRSVTRQAGAETEDARRQRVQEMTARINARRAQRGLPPIKEQ
jgi:hypothetical protein